MRAILLFLLASFLLVSSYTKLSAQADTIFEPGIVICKLPDSADDKIDTTDLKYADFKLLLLKYKVTDMYKACPSLSSKLDRLYILKTSQRDELVAAIDSLGNMEFVEKLPHFRLFHTPDDLDPTQYSLIKIMAQRAWDVGKGSKNTTVAIVDNGVRLTHEDLSANIWRNQREIAGNGLDDDFNGYIDDVFGYDVADDDNDPSPPAGIADTSGWVHGTHCAGISGATTNNGKGIASIGYGLKIMAVKCAPDNSNGRSLNSAFDGIVYALRAGAVVISMSFGTHENSQAVKLLMDQASELGRVMVAAAGNDNNEAKTYPAAYTNVIAVAATDQNDKKASFSSYGSWVDVAAPGVSIKSTFAGSDISYGSLSGTSMATPLVAGLAGLIYAEFPGMTAAQVRNQIKNTADKIDLLNPTYAGKLGSGRINAARAMGINVSVGEEPLAMNFNLYPNPVNSQESLKISYDPSHSTFHSFEIYAADGRLMQYILPKASANTMEIAVNTLPAGMYLIKANATSGIAVARFIVR